jgi:hypothetical protein
MITHFLILLLMVLDLFDAFTSWVTGINGYQVYVTSGIQSGGSSTTAPYELIV